MFAKVKCRCINISGNITKHRDVSRYRDFIQMMHYDVEITSLSSPNNEPKLAKNVTFDGQIS